MRLQFCMPVTEYDHKMYPHGYWDVTTNDEEFDAVGPDPLTAVSALALKIEAELAEWTGTAARR